MPAARAGHRGRARQRLCVGAAAAAGNSCADVNIIDGVMDAQQAPRPRPLINVRDAAALVGVTESTGYRWLKRGELPGAVRVGGRWYVRGAVVLAWLKGANVPDPPRCDSWRTT